MSDSSLPSRQRQLRNLVVVALADGQFDEQEVNVIGRRCGQLGLGASELQSAIASGLDEHAALSLPSDPAERIELMRDLMQVISADGLIHEGEKRLFALAAVKMKISSTDLDRLIESFLK